MQVLEAGVHPFWGVSLALRIAFRALKSGAEGVGNGNRCKRTKDQAPLSDPS